MTAFSLQSIGIAHSPFSERFGVPRQAGLIPVAGSIELFAATDSGITDGIDAFSHLWLLFMFDRNPGNQWKPRVRPPRLGGNDRVGVFASRSPFRPNPIGMSLVRYQGQEIRNNRLHLLVEGLDLVNGTAIIDIKPHLPYADCPENSFAQWADRPPARTHTVQFSHTAGEALQQYDSQYPKLESLISDVLAYDPRPAYQQDDPNRVYGIKLYGLNIQWVTTDNTSTVIKIAPVDA